MLNRPVASRLLALLGALLFLTNADVAGAAPDKLRFTDCDEQTAEVLVSPAALPPLPDNFSYGNPIPGIPLAGVHISGSRCADVAGRGPTQDVIAFALVVPPPELQSEGITAYGIILGGYVQRLVTAQAYEGWGIEGLVNRGNVDWQVRVGLLGRHGTVSAADSKGGVTYRINTFGPVLQPGGGTTRAFHFVDGELVASIDVLYTPQTGMLGSGFVSQTGDGPLPFKFGVATGSHAWDYDLELGNPQRY